MYALMASGLSLIFGIMGVKNFSHGELFMIGGYVMFYVTVVLDLPWPVGVAAAALVLLVVGMLIERTLIETPRRRAGRDWQIDAVVLPSGMLVIMQTFAPLLFGTEQRGGADRPEGPLVTGPPTGPYKRPNT